MSICHQCELPGIARSSLYYTPSKVGEKDLQLMEALDRLYCEDPTRGTRRMVRGYMYLLANMDIYSRSILGWRLSNTMEAEWVVDTLRMTVNRYGKPEFVLLPVFRTFLGHPCNLL